LPAATAPRAIRADGAAFTYAGSPRPAFRDIELTVDPGAVLLVVGPSGSGKSTLARAVAGLLPEQFPGEWQGSFRVGDVDAARGETGAGSEGPGAGSDVAIGPSPITTRGLGAGIVLQDPASQLVMERVGDDVAFGLENLAWPPGAMRERVPEALAGVGLRGFEDRRSNRLSGGEQQRVAIAGVLAPGPGLLVLDEPTAHLDAGGAEAVFRILRTIRERQAATVVLVEHRAELAWPLADLVLALDDDGTPIDLGSPKAVLKRSARKLERAGIWLPEERDRSSSTSGDRRAAAGPEAGAEPVLEVAGVRFGFTPAAAVLRSVDLVLEPGERVGLVGRNGSGKTTLLRLALGLLRPGAGRIRLAGRDPRRVPGVQLARLAGFVAQEPELGFLGESVRDEIELGLTVEETAYAHELAERLRLPLAEFADRSPYRLSGGEQRRLSLVTGLARRPTLLALDEPTFGQDRRGHEALVSALAELVGEGSALLAATHDERFVRDATDRRVELADGWVLADEAVDAGGAGSAA
jgi:energy-coupling factor transport system ATP-binding protein